MRRIVRVLLLAGAALALAAPAAMAATTRYAGVSGNDGGGANTCTDSNSPCTIQGALNKAVAGDEVVILPGTYVLTAGISIPTNNLEVHGADGQPRPQLVANGNFTALAVGPFVTGTNVRYLYVEQQFAGASAFSGSGDGIFERLILVTKGANSTAASISNTSVLRDSVAWATGSGSTALQIATGFLVGSAEVELRNVTAFAPGASSTALLARGAHVCVFGCTDQTATVTAKNVIARGSQYDLQALASSSSPSADNKGTINISYSNYDPGHTNTGSFSVINDQGNNQTGAPSFVNSGGGDFHQVAGSPTIDAGTTDANTGIGDFDNEGRPQGAAMDIGADELVPGAPPPPPPPPPPPVPTPTPAADHTAPITSLVFGRLPKLGTVLKNGLSFVALCNEPCTLRARLLVSRALAKRIGIISAFTVTVGTKTSKLAGGVPKKVTVKLTRKAKSKLKNLKSVRFKLKVTTTDAAGNVKTKIRFLTLRRA